MAQIVDLRKKGIKTGKRWEVDYRDNTNKRKRARFEVKREAEAYLSEVTGSLNKGSYIDPKQGNKVTVSTLWIEYLERLSAVGAGGRGATSAKTLDTYRRQWENYIQPRWGDTRLASIHYEDVAEWILSLQAVGRPSGTEERLAGAETKKAVGTLFSRMLDYAVNRRHLARNPAKNSMGTADYMPGKKEVRATKRPHVYLTMGQLVAVADRCEGYDDLVMLCGLGGLRWGEVSALQVADLVLGRKASVNVRRAYREIGGELSLGPTKGGEHRLVPLPSLLAETLTARAEGRPASELLFTSPNGAALRNNNFVRRYYKPAVELAARASADPEAFPRPTFHDLRHTAVSLAISQGANVKVVQRIAGHADATTTLNTYAGLFDEDLYDSADRLDKALRRVTALPPTEM